MYLSELPSEIILIIAECLESQPTINALAQTSSAFYALLNPFLYRYHVQHRVPAPALEWAAERGHAGTLQKLLKAGADIYCKRPWSLEPRSFYFHPINRAAERGHTRIVEILLDEGMHDRLTDLNYTTILRSAIPTNQIDVVKLLLSRGVNPWYTADGSSTICHTVRHGDAGLVRLLLLDAEQRDSLSPAIIRHEIGRALCVSAGKSEDITRMLLAAGADIDFREKDRVTTALTIASSLKRVSMLKFLLEAGANPNILNSDIWGPLASATLNKCDLRPWDDTRRFVRYQQDSQNDMPHLPECLKIKKS